MPLAHEDTLFTAYFSFIKFFKGYFKFLLIINIITLLTIYILLEKYPFSASKSTDLTFILLEQLFKTDIRSFYERFTVLYILVYVIAL